MFQGFATRFVLRHAMEHGGDWDSNVVAQLKRLGGWGDRSEVVHLYIKRIIKQYSDTCALVTEGNLSEIVS